MNEDKQEFIIDDLAKAEWAMKKISAAQNKISELNEQSAKMKSDIDKWLEGELKPLTDEIEHFQAKLMPFINEQLKDSKKKSVNMPSGKAGYRKGGVSFSYKGNKITSNSPEFIEYVKENNPNYIETTDTVKWAEMKKDLKIENGKAITGDGEILDIDVNQEEDKFYVKAN